MGSTCPKLAMLRMDADHAQIRLNANSLLAGINMRLGVDLKQDYQDMTAEVQLR